MKVIFLLLAARGDRVGVWQCCFFFEVVVVIVVLVVCYWCGLVAPIKTKTKNKNMI